MVRSSNDARLPERQSSLDYSARHEVPGLLDGRASRVQPSGFTPFSRAIVQTVDTLFERYGEFHRNPVNKAIHWVCVPLIVWSVLGMLWALSPIVACIAVAASMAFYVRLSLPLALGMLILVALMVWLLTLLGAQTFWVCLVDFRGGMDRAVRRVTWSRGASRRSSKMCARCWSDPRGFSASSIDGWGSPTDRLDRG